MTTNSHLQGISRIYDNYGDLGGGGSQVGPVGRTRGKKQLIYSCQFYIVMKKRG